MGTRKKTICCVFGTRPEAIKLAPVIYALQAAAWCQLRICVTAQHRELLDQELRFFGIVPDIDMNLMRPDQGLPELTAGLMQGLSDTLRRVSPDLVLVQGDTATTFVGALAAYYQKIPVGHVEAGLRSHDPYAPFPEEMNRRLVAPLAQWHFAPTPQAAEWLQREGIAMERIFVTGNTIVDSLRLAQQRIAECRDLQGGLDRWFARQIDMADGIHRGLHRLIVVTTHRRESFGDGIAAICEALRRLALRYTDCAFVFSVHPNPRVREPVRNALAALPNLYLVDPFDYPKMVYLLQRAYLVLTDSGGLQEEPPSLRVPMVVLRDQTERMEGIHQGISRLAGTTVETIVAITAELLDDPRVHQRMQATHNPYGDGHAAECIAAILQERL